MDTHTYLIAMFDVLGFKSRLKQFGLNTIRERYELLTEQATSLNRGVAGRFGGMAIFGKAYASHFSDTILFWTSCEGRDLGMVHPFLVACNEMICGGLECGLPLRGALSIGECVMDKDKDIYLGEPIVEAAQVERAQVLIGASFGASLFESRFPADILLPYKSHIKSGKEDLIFGATLDWPRHWRSTRNANVSSVVSALNDDPEFTCYYDSTIRFIDYSEKQHDWFKNDPWPLPFG